MGNKNINTRGFSRVKWNSANLLEIKMYSPYTDTFLNVICEFESVKDTTKYSELITTNVFQSRYSDRI